MKTTKKQQPITREMALLMRLDRPIGTWLVMGPALWGVVCAQNGAPNWGLLVIFALGAFVMRSAGCVANDLADRDLDPHVERTRDRPLAARRISVQAALGLLVFLLSVALGLAFMLNALAIQMAIGGAFLALTYPFLKRIVPIPQFYLGMAFGWGVIVAWAAAANAIPLDAWLLFGATVAWTAGYDTIYAMMDRPDDIKVGIQSTARLFGRHDIPAVGTLYAIALLFLFVAGYRMGLPPVFYGILMVVEGHMAWQLYRIRNYQAEALLGTFLSNKWLGLIILIGFGLR
jgi:4-hydroxybenzoate polyprenyltransferase